MKKRIKATGTTVVLKLASLMALLIFLFSLSTNVSAQNGATITGRVKDERGAVVQGAEVRLRSRTGIKLFARTDENGVYGFNGLAPGDYILEVDVVQEGVSWFGLKGSKTWRGRVKVN